MIITNVQEVFKHFENLRLDKDPKERENYGIFVNGKRVRLSNGKVVWNKKNHASAAMRNEFERYLFPCYTDYPRQTLGTTDYEQQYQEIKNQRRFMEELYKELKIKGIIQFLPV